VAVITAVNAPQEVTYTIEIRDRNGLVGDALVYVNNVRQDNHGGRVLITVVKNSTVSVSIFKDGYDTIETSFTAVVNRLGNRKIFYNESNTLC